MFFDHSLVPYVRHHQGHSARGYESTDDSFDEASGDSGKDEHNVETAESGERDTEQNDDGHEEGFHEDGASGVSVSRSVNAKKDARRSFEKGIDEHLYIYICNCCVVFAYCNIEEKAYLVQ